MIEPQLRDHLRTLVEAYAQAAGCSEATASLRATKDHKFIGRITTPDDEGRTPSFSVRKYDEITAWFRDNWPDGAAWPAGVPKPKRIAA